MKRLFALLLALGMLFTSTLACAEEFTLRKGITFGDTIDEVFAKETIPFDKTYEDLNYDESDFPYSIQTESDTVAGISDSYIEYQFDKNKTLRIVTYCLAGYYSESEASIDYDYDNINSALIRKYGTPLGYSNGDCYIITGYAFESAVAPIYYGKNGDIMDYDEWDVNTGDYHVKIDQVKFYLINRDGEQGYGHRLSYTYFTDEDVQNALNEKQEQQNLVDSEI